MVAACQEVGLASFRVHPVSSILSPTTRSSRVILSFSCRPPAIDCNRDPCPCFRVWPDSPEQRRGSQKGIAWLRHCVPTQLIHMISTKMYAECAIRFTHRCVTDLVCLKVRVLEST